MVYFFTALDKLNDQTNPADAFGPLSEKVCWQNQQSEVL
jgi:hypothetical protein